MHNAVIYRDLDNEDGDDEDEDNDEDNNEDNEDNENNNKDNNVVAAPRISDSDDNIYSHKENEDEVDAEVCSVNSEIVRERRHGSLTVQTEDLKSDAESDLTPLSSSTSSTTRFPTSAGQPSASSPGSAKIKAYGLVIDFDNAFSLTEAIEHGYNINSVSNSDDI